MSPEEIREENTSAKTAQIMRVAETTSRGGDLMAAAGLYRRASKFAPDDPAPLLGLGRTLDAAQAYRDAAEAYRDALALPALNKTDEAVARYGYGRALIYLNRPELAVTEFQHVVRLRPDDSSAFNLLGVSLDLTGQHKDAQASYRSALALKADRVSVRNNLGLSLALSGDFDQAIQTLTVLARDPIAQAQHKLNLALVFGLAGRMEDAEREAARLLSSDQVANNLAYYETLTTMAPADRARAVFGFR